MTPRALLAPAGSLLLALAVAACATVTAPDGDGTRTYVSPLGFSMDLPPGVEAFEDPAEDRTFIASTTYGDGKRTTPESLVTDPESAAVSWIVARTDIADDARLDAWVKEHYGPGCAIAERAPTSQPGVFDVLLEGDGLPLDESRCVLNFVYEIRYQPSRRRAFSWELGQGPRFVSYGEETVMYDMEMRDSFRVTD